jgi:DNA modification methylase
MNKIILGDCIEELKKLESESVNCIMTSPPYWALRDYGVEGQLGLEPTFEEYINNLCDIFDECKRVLRKDGTCWVNIGDTYFGSGKGAGGDISNSKQIWTFENKETKTCQHCGKFFEGYKYQEFCGSACSGVDNTPRQLKGKMQDKCLVQIPHRFAIEMCNRGWILRNTIIWHKPNAMPSSVKDRFTVDFEYIFFFTKNKKYWFETQYEPYEAKINRWGGDKLKAKGVGTWDKGTGQTTYRDRNMRPNNKGRNKRTTWSINTKPYSEAHFAVYPEELCETPIKAGCPKYVCNKCDKPKEKIVEIRSGKGEGKSYDGNRPDGMKFEGRNRKSEYYFKGYSSCKCNVGFEGGTVLDPFFGAGTTGVVALKQNKKFIGIELNEEYIKIAKARIKPHLEQTTLTSQDV